MSKLSRDISKQVGVSEIVVREVLQGMTDCIAKELQNTGEISIPSFGTVKLAENKPRRFRNVHTGDIDSKSQMRLTLTTYDSFKKRFSMGKTLE